MYGRHVIGKKGENIAVEYILQNEYEIIERNFSCRQGEIDIIARDREEYVFIEVKTRTNRNYGEPIDAITSFKKKHIIKSIEYYLFLRRLEHVFVRIDVIEIYQKENRYYINHIKNAISR